MSYPATTCRLIEVIGQQRVQMAFWDGACTNGRQHFARVPVGPVLPADQRAHPKIETGWDGACGICGEPVPWDDVNALNLAAAVDNVWDTDSGKPEPGDMYWLDEYQGRCFHWSNCPGRHLHVVLPNGHPWDIDGRARNCDRPDDREHRCWVRSGEPPKVTAGKAGNTCSAGAGSILAGDYHGFLQDGTLTAG